MLNIKKFLNLEYYTSELEQFLAEYTKNHPVKSASQQAEFNKHKRIATLRDNTDNKKDII